MNFKKHVPTILWTLLILALCSMPGKSIPKFNWLEMLSFDKWVHASLFCVLQVLVMRSFAIQRDNGKSNKVWATVLCVTYGGLLEVMQTLFFSERTGDILDFIANTVGCLAGLSLYKVLKRGRTSFKKS